MGQSTQNEVEQYSIVVMGGNNVTNVLSCPLAVKGSDRSRHIFGRYDFFAFPIIIKDLSRISVTTCFCHIFVSVCFPSKRPAWPSFGASDII